MDNQDFGQQAFTRIYDPDFVDGWGKRPYNWEPGRVGAAGAHAAGSVNVGYFRNTLGNLYTVDNRSTAPPTTRPSASRRPSTRGCLTAAAGRSADCTT